MYNANWGMFLDEDAPSFLPSLSSAMCAVGLDVGSVEICGGGMHEAWGNASGYGIRSADPDVQARTVAWVAEWVRRNVKRNSLAFYNLPNGGVFVRSDWYSIGD